MTKFRSFIALLVTLTVAPVFVPASFAQGLSFSPSVEEGQKIDPGDVSWTPFISSWSCVPAEASSIACKLQAYGVPPEGVGSQTPTAKAWYLVRKGLTRGKGTILTLVQTTLPCTTSSGYLICVELTPSLTLGPGVQLVSAEAGIPPGANIYASGVVAGPLFDWDGDGAITEKEALLLMRYLMGFRGLRLVQGVALSAGITSATVESQIQMLILAGVFHFSGRLVATSTSDALVALRCIKGLRGSALTRGLTSRSTTEVDAMCESMMAVN